MEYTDAALDALRAEGDPLADAVIAALVAAGDLAGVNRLLQELQENDGPVPVDLPPVVQAYLRETARLPAWVDPARLDRVHAFFLDDGPAITAVLALGAMVECYAVPHGAKLLAMTHRLDYPQRRLTETGQFCIYLMSNQAFAPHGQFIPAAQKVRLIHAAVRSLINARGAWPRAQYGEPICQEDLLGALLLFSYQVLLGLGRLGVRVAPAEAEDFYYAWRIAGAMLGIREDIMPATVAEAAALNVILKRRHIGASPEGIRLTQSFLAMFADMIPGTRLDGVALALVRHVVGDEIANLMEVPHTGWDRVAAHLGALGTFWEGTENLNPLLGKALDKIAWAMLQGQMRHFGGGRNPHYDIPADLRAGWGMDPGE